jgi:hypothetical protein
VSGDFTAFKAAGPSLFLLFDDTAASEDGFAVVGSSDDTFRINDYTAGSATTRILLTGAGQLRVGDNVGGLASLCSLSYTQAGFVWQSNAQLDVFLANAQRFYFLDTTGSSGPSVNIANGAFGAGAVGGSAFNAGRNSSGSGASGHIAIQNAGGTYYYLWVDATGDLRIGTAAPTANLSVSDTSGTVVGTQT